MVWTLAYALRPNFEKPQKLERKAAVKVLLAERSNNYAISITGRNSAWMLS
jgi:hypothetical protein